MKKIFLSAFFFVTILSVNIFAQTNVGPLYIGPDLVKCNGMIEQMCMNIRSSLDQPYEPYGGPIEGFTYEEGYDYELLIEKVALDGSTNEMPRFKYVLKNVVSKTFPQVTLHIANRKADCEDTKIFSCLLYREGDDQEWHNLYAKINGFKYKNGYEYELLAFKKLNVNTGAGKTYTYNLIRVVKQEPTMVISKKNRELFADGRKFYLTGINNNGKFEKLTAPQKAFITFRLNENSMGGSDGCNTMGGRIEINNSNIKIGPVMSTQMACEGVTIDRIIHSYFPKINKYKISNNSTIKFYENKTLLLEYTMAMEDVLPPDIEK